MYSNRRWKITVILGCLLPACGPVGNNSQSVETMPAEQQVVKVQSNINGSPHITSLPVTEVISGFPYLYQPVAVEPDGDKLTWALRDPPPGMLIDSDSGFITAQSLPAGRHEVRLEVADGKGGSASQDFTVNVSAGPVIVSVPAEYTYLGTPYRYQVEAIDPAGTGIHFTVSKGPAGMHINADNGLLEWTAGIEGRIDIGITVTDSLGTAHEQVFVLTVMSPQSVAIVSEPVTEAYVSLPYEYRLASLSMSPDVDYSLDNAPAGMTLDAKQGVINWIPAREGVHTLEVVVTNQHGHVDTQEFTITINSLEYMDTMFANIVDEMFAGLSRGDMTAVMNCLTADAQQRLAPLFNELIGQAGTFSANYTKPARVSILPGIAEYMLRRTGDDGDRVFMITFLRDKDGQWKINDL